MAANSTRESVSKNSLNHARDASKRFPELQSLCRKFVATYERRTEAPDEKWGFKKYKAMLQKAANGELETITIDLNDVEDFAKNEILSPDDRIAEEKGIPKIQLQQSIERWVSDIEMNTARYTLYFYEACDAELPERDRTDAETSAKDIVMKWRTRMAASQTTEGGDGSASAGIPSRLKNDFEVRFSPRASRPSMKLREISANSVGSLVQLDCLVVRTTQVKPRVEVVAYHCEVCDAEIFQSVEGERYNPLKECPSQRCKDNKQSGKLRQNNRTSKFSKYQEMRVQEMSEHVPVGGVPRAITVVMAGDLTRCVLPGDAITVTGVYTPSAMPWFKQGKGATQEMHLEAHHIKKHKHGYNEESADQSELSRSVDELWAQGNIYEHAAKSIAPEIWGHDDVKKALLLVLIGSFTKQMKDGMKIRGDIHTLFMGDPGVAKSQLLKQVCNIAPRSVYTTGKGTSGVGLTATVIRDNSTGEVTLEGGALVLADMGICCIDEFDKMEESDRTAIHEVMEQQSVSIAKAGITTTLNCRTTVLAAANPVFGRYNPYKSPVENIDLPPALLSRFDLLFLLLDTVDGEKDKKLAMHVCRVHTNFQKADGEKHNAAVGDIYDFKPLDANIMRTYIRKARTYEPLVADDLQRDIVDAYCTMREEEKMGEQDSRKSYTTPRTLLAILRLSQAHARTRFSDTVERQDFDEAIRLMKASKESVEASAPAAKNTNPLDLVYDIIADLSRQSSDKDGWVDMAHVVSMAGHKALRKEQVEEAVENWEGLSVLVRDPEKIRVKFLVGSA